MHTLIGELPQPVLQEPLVVCADRPDEDLGSVWKALEHSSRIAAQEPGLCALGHAIPRARRAALSTAAQTSSAAAGVSPTASTP